MNFIVHGLGPLLLGYLCGSVPFGLFFAQMAGAGDVRKIGSGNIGATNVLRTGKRWAAAATFVCDALKGGIPVAVLSAYDTPLAAMLCALGAILGHLFPVWLGFKGGKGISTFFGTMIALFWPAGLLAGATWIAMAFAFRISSLAALTATALLPAYLIAFGRYDDAVLALLLAVLLWFMHRENISRLLKGQEPRIGAKSA